MVEHLTREQIAALLDEPDALAGGLAHLEVCSECAREFEAMSRTRMALSGLSDLEAPRDAWTGISDALSGSRAPGGERRDGPSGAAPAAKSVVFSALQTRWGPPLMAAAVLVLFLGGLGTGRFLASVGPSGDSTDPPAELEAVARGGEYSAEPSATSADYPEYRRNVAGLWQLREEGPSTEQIAGDPALAAERITHLDALIEASREALRTAPADPALNDFLFDVVDERASVAGQLDQTIRQASMEY